MFKVLFKITVLTVFFSFLIFFAKNYFFGGFEKYENTLIEEKYIEPHIDNSDEKVKEKILENLKSAKKVDYHYFPENFGNSLDTLSYKELLDTFFYSKYLNNKIEFLNIELHHDEYEVRGRMKDKKVKLFGIFSMEKPEFLSVGIHEFAHFLDLYILKKSVSKDVSDYFYNISWEKTKVLKAGMKNNDFVSGYAMTNKYEDFAESFTYYVIHNSDFLEKTKSSEILKQKYDFFNKYVFLKDEFKTSDLSSEKLKNYYRDTTKIDFSLENFIDYLK